MKYLSTILYLLVSASAINAASGPIPADSTAIDRGGGYRYYDRPVDSDLYLIRPGDELTVTFINAKIDPLVLKVDPEGRIIDATLGVFDFSGRTLIQARETLTETLSRLYQVDEIAVSVGPPSVVAINVSGGVARPGLYTGYTSQRVSELIDTAGGVTSSGSHRWILFSGGPTEVVVDLDRAQFKGDDWADPCLYAGYSIYVKAKSTNRIQVVGEVNNPREVELVEGDDLDLILSLAGGARAAADLNRLEVIRGAEKLDAIGLPIKSGDVIVVPSRVEFTDATELAVFGAILKPGRYQFVDGITLRELLQKSGGLTKHASGARTTIFRRAAVDEWGRVTTTRFPIATTSGSDREFADILLQPADSIFVPVVVGYVRVRGAVRNPGLFPYYDDRTAAFYISQAGGFVKDADEKMIDIYNRISHITEARTPKVLVHDGDEIVVNIREELR